MNIIKKEVDMDMDIVTRIQQLPIDIRRYIITYTYRIQSKDILEDIRSFVETKSKINKIYYYRQKIFHPESIYTSIPNVYKYWIIRDIFRFINEYESLNRKYIFYRFFTRNRILQNKTNLEIERVLFLLETRYSPNHIIFFLWGLLKPIERNKFIKIHGEIQIR